MNQKILYTLIYLLRMLIIQIISSIFNPINWNMNILRPLIVILTYNKSMNKQMTLEEINDEFGAARINKREFLEKVDSIIPWVAKVKIVDPYYYKEEHGNRPYQLKLMLRIFILQNLYNLADMKAMYEILDSRAFGEFCIMSTHNDFPDVDSYGRFRNLLMKHGLQK